MSSKAKHALRSHRSYSNKAAIFGKFEAKASRIKYARQLNSGPSLFERIKNLFKRQSR